LKTKGTGKIDELQM